MAQLVKKDFEKFFPEPNEVEQKIPSFLDSNPVIQMLLDYLTKNNLKSQNNAIKLVFQKV